MNNNKEIARRFFSLFPVKKQSELAKRLKVSPATISQWKSGVKPVPRQRLMKAYRANSDKVSLEWILGFDLEVKSDPTIPAPNFRTEVAGIIHDALSFCSDWWKSGKKLNPKWSTIEVAVKIPELEGLSLNERVQALEEAATKIHEIAKTLPHDSLESVAQYLLLENYVGVLKRTSQLFALQSLITRVEALERRTQEQER